MTLVKMLPMVALMLQAMREPVAARWAASGGWPVSLPRQGLPSRPGAAVRGALARCCRWGWDFGMVLSMVPGPDADDARAANYPTTLVGN